MSPQNPFKFQELPVCSKEAEGAKMPFATDEKPKHSGATQRSSPSLELQSWQSSPNPLSVSF